MKVIFLLTFLISVAFAADTSSLLESFDISTVTNNNRLLGSYIRCLLGTGTCTREGKEIKKILPNFLTMDPSKAQPKRAKDIRQVICVIQKKRPDDWRALQTKYDPNGVYEKNFNTEQHRCN